MHDIRALREAPDVFDAAIKRRGMAPIAAELLQLDEKLRAAQTTLQAAHARRNDASRLIGQAKARGDHQEAQALMQSIATLKESLPQLEAEEQQASAALSARLAEIPNCPADDVPDGRDERDNQELRHHGIPRCFDFPPLEHDALGARLGMDFDTAARLSGARFVVLSGGIARLERALAQFMLDVQTTVHGYRECAVPFLVRDEALYGTGQLPKFADDLFRTDNGYWLIPTAEVSLTNLVREQILEGDTLPLRLTAYTPCFRSEAGASGRDTRGMIRQHQFGKVELVSITAPEESAQEHERMVACAEDILKRLGLAFRTMVLCAGDMGFAARKTYDLEVWLPGQGRYREISSCSNCGDFQARRMNARMRMRGEKATRHVHTLNGSGLAVGRTLVALLETYQNADGSISLPEVLHPYMSGITRLDP